mgnify:CR=1 FL=1
MRDIVLKLRSNLVNFLRPQNRVLFNMVIRLKLKLIPLISLHVWKRWFGISINLLPSKLIVFIFNKSLNASLDDKINDI